MKILLLVVSLFVICMEGNAQEDSTQKDNDIADALYIEEVEEKAGPLKILHAEPLYIDLIRDLGARKGEREWNVGLGLTDNNDFDEYATLIEYEFAPVDRLGLEVELPFSFYSRLPDAAPDDPGPGNRLNSIKMAAQYSFFVSNRMKTTLAVGYIHEFELVPFRDYSKGSTFRGNVFNPFFIAARRWGNNFHTLIYTGPHIVAHRSAQTDMRWDINSNFHYMIPGTRNFIGVEFNKNVREGDFDMVIRPQLRVAIANNLLVGIVTGVPIKRENQRFSTFLRLIYEPGH